jgi:formylglycine-generating enzyme required for sulfatase activity
VDIPIPRTVPDGFVYVPPGRTLYGSTDDEATRKFFGAVPQHTRTTGGYFIARYETTYGDWLAYLDDVSEAERAAHTPKLNASGVSGGRVVLSRTAGGWTLELTPVGVMLGPVAAGAPLHYPERDAATADHDWRRLPVSGVSYEDVLAYTAWLARSGRVPGARPCTELEWERAARGADDRAYPGGFELAPGDANFDETYGKKAGGIGPDTVGNHPASRSPFGVDDLAGNVWEWVATPDTSQATGARGGAFYSSKGTLQIANREKPEPNFRDVTLGVRVCASSP